MPDGVADIDRWLGQPEKPESRGDPAGIVSEPFSVDAVAIAAMAGAGAGVVLLVRLLTLPALWRLMRPDGLRTE